ncbi:MAG: hypothetical protein JXR03_13275 [Cyclobacteriaceae bacterium]
MDFSFLVSISDGDQDFIKEFIAIFESTTLKQIEKMSEDFKNGDFDSLKKTAHQVKPTSEMLSFKTHDLVIKINKEPDTTTAQQIEEILSEANEVLVELKQEFS